MPRAKGVSSINLSLRVSMQNAKNAFREYMVLSHPCQGLFVGVRSKC
jgi:hypothetical protein